MKILFICGCLEQGRDGVGDYVRRLANEISIQGHQVAMMALHDSYVKEVKEYRPGKTMQLAELRIPGHVTFNQKSGIAKNWISAFSPDWISLQYVPFSFHVKGLPYKLNNFLKKLSKEAKWHIMFHELWLVSKSILPIKRRIAGALQKQIINKLVRSLRPAVIHTQTQFSQYQLKKIRIEAKLLPLFSNIPVVSKENNTECDKNIRLVSFGSIHPNSCIEQFANEAAAYKKRTSKEIILTIIGRSGERQKEWMSVWERAGLKVELIGEQPPEKVSEIFQSSSKGISSTPYVMSEKSGAIAAMREHSIPVICIADKYTPKDFSFAPPEGVLEYSKNSFEECITYQTSFPNNINATHIANRFLNDLLAII